MTTTQIIDSDRLQAFVGRAIGELGATLNAALVVIGDRLGLYRALADAGPLRPQELADRTGTTARYVEEWLNAQAAGGFVQYDPDVGRYGLSPEQALALTEETSEAFLPGAFQAFVALVRDERAIGEAFVTGGGVGWHEHDHDLVAGTERFFRPGYAAHLTSEWIPALDGIEARLRWGGRVADVGCGHGASTILMADAYPTAAVTGFDYHARSIDEARRAAAAAGLGDRVAFEVADAGEIPGGPFDLVTTFDALHDMGDPIGVARRIRSVLADGGAWLIVEPYAGDRVEDNLTPIGRIYYAASTLSCTPGALSQEGGLALGAQAGEARLREVVTAAGFTRFRRASETPVNLVLEARP
jgi:SAM-dependent methyltransferase